MNDNSHLNKFSGQCSCLISEPSYRRFYRGHEDVGYPADANNPDGSMFVSTSNDIDRALSDCNGDISKLEESLGFPQGHFGDGPVVRVDINNPEEHGLRMAAGTEPGANEFYNTPLDENGNLPDIKYADADHRIIDTNKTEPSELSKLNGQYLDQNGQYHAPNPEGYQGKTSGGLDEAVINSVPNNSENITYTKIDGFNRGECGNLKSSSISDGYSNNNLSSGISSQNVVSKNGGGSHAPPTNNNQIAGSLPQQTPETPSTNPEKAGTLPQKEPDNPPTNTQIAGTTPDKKQELDINLNHEAAKTGIDNAKAVTPAVTGSNGIT